MNYILQPISKLSISSELIYLYDTRTQGDDAQFDGNNASKYLLKGCNSSCTWHICIT